jgi:lipid A 3-O-deacylase
VKRIAIVLGALGLSVAAPAHAGELFGGLFVHDVKTPLTHSGIEGGLDLQLGWRGGRIGPTPLQLYAFAAINTAGNTNYGAVGISAKFGDKLYVRPGLGVAVHTGSAGNFQQTDRIAFGSRILFAPELSVGARVNDRVSVEASWVHMSHAQLLSSQNPGIDNFGLRLNFAF